MPKRDRRVEIMAAAEKLFTSRRYHEITLDDVVHQAHVGKGTVYRYFRNKDDLFFQTATRGSEELCDLIRRRVPGRAAFERQLLGACRQISAFFRRRRQLMRMMQAEEARMFWCDGPMRQRWMARRRRLVSAVAEILRKGMVEGKVRRDIPPEMLAQFLLGMLRTRARDLEDAPEDRRPIELVISLFCRGAGQGEPDKPEGGRRAARR